MHFHRPRYSTVRTDGGVISNRGKDNLRIRCTGTRKDNAADELLSNWKEIKGVVEKTESLNEKDRKLQVKAASTGGKGSGEPMSRKIYRRSEIVNLMINDPQRYQANVDLFDKAYAEGRVK